MESVLTLCLIVLLLPAVRGFQADDTDRECAFTDHLQGAGPSSEPANELRGSVRENATIRCSRGSRCYGLWEKKPDGETHLVKQGCWTHIGNQQECRGDRCLVTAPPSQVQNGSYRFCCCSRDLCNVNFTEAPTSEHTPDLRPMKTDRRGDRQTDHKPLSREESALIALVTVAIAAVVIGALFLGYRMIRGKQKLSLSALDVMEAANTDSNVDLDNLKLLELIGRGRYGTVFRGCLNDRCVAVKLFSSSNRQNYVNERSIYNVPLLQQHDNIARFLSADERTGVDGRPEFLILMEFYPHGCLSRYLSLHTVDWLTCCRMNHGVTRGLAFLHTELYRSDQYKAAVAHRDVTSRNVLVRSDLSCVLADFGLSMKLTGSHTCRQGDDDTVAISEVGTVRYMAPEVLGGALNLRDAEAALKQVDVYALGLLYWESFRRCEHLFPGDCVPAYQLAFQEELGNHPSFEEMQILVAREKFRPRFPEVWKENSPLLRSLKETMEDCWDQDAEARLTAQCAEERLTELTLMSTHTAVHNNRNLSSGRWAPQLGSSHIEDQVGVVKNLQGDSHLVTVVRATTSGGEGTEKNRNCINYERQQAQNQARSLCSDGILPESEHAGVTVRLQLTEEDLEATKLDPKEVDKNLRESSDENLMEHSQKQFGSTERQHANLLYHQIIHNAETSSSVLMPHNDLGGAGGVDSPPSSAHPLPKQLNLPQRPTSLHLLHKTKDTTPTSTRLKLGKIKLNHRQVETGVAKMNTVTVATAVEPHMVTTVSNNNTSTRGSVVTMNRPVQPVTVVTHGYSSGVPTLVTNSVIGRINPAGPQLEEEEKMEAPLPTLRIGGPEEIRINLFNPSPDENAPLLMREQPPDESTPNMLSGIGSNSNNNNNRIALGPQIKIQGLENEPRSNIGLDLSQNRGVNSPKPESNQASQMSENQERIKKRKSESPANVTDTNPGNSVIGSEVGRVKINYSPAALTNSLNQGSNAGPQNVLYAKPELTSQCTISPESHQVQNTINTTVPSRRERDSTSPSEEQVLESLKLAQEIQTLNSATSDRENQVVIPTTKPLEIEVLDSHDQEIKAQEIASFLRPKMGPTKAKRPDRPCSLDLSSPCISPDGVPLPDTDPQSVSGEKIKRRVKTPYTVKKWRPASLVVTTDTALDPDFAFTTTSSSSNPVYFSSGLQRAAGGFGIPKINQSKSSMAVFLVGGGGTATTTSEPDGMTSF